MYAERKECSLRVVATLVVFMLLVACSSTAQQYDTKTANALELGRRASEGRKYREAVKRYKEALKLQNGSCFECYLGLASAYAQLGDFDNADSNADNAIRVASGKSQQSLAHATKGLVLMRLGSEEPKRLAASESEYRQAVADDGQNDRARFELAVCLLKQKRDEEGVRELQGFMSENPNSPFLKQAQSFIANPRRAREWFAPEFTVSTLQGQTISSRELAGKIVVLDFWATWCPPCRASIPEIKDLLKKYPREKLVVVSISGDESEAAWKEFVAKKEMDWPQVFGKASRALAEAFNVHALPTYIVIDGEGFVRQRIIGTDPRASVAYRLRDTLKDMRELN